MPTRLENANTALDNAYAELAALNSTKDGGKPSYTVGRQSFDHNGYMNMLLKRIEVLEKRIAILQGPVQEEHRGLT